MPLIGLLVDCTLPKKESVRLKIGQQKLPKLKYKEKRTTTTKLSKKCGKTAKATAYV